MLVEYQLGCTYVWTSCSKQGGSASEGSCRGRDKADVAVVWESLAVCEQLSCTCAWAASRKQDGGFSEGSRRDGDKVGVVMWAVRIVYHASRGICATVS